MSDALIGTSVVIIFACLATLYKIAYVNEVFYEKITSNLTKVLCIIAAFSAGYFIKDETEIGVLLYLLSLIIVPVFMLILAAIGFVASELRSKEQL